MKKVEMGNSDQCSVRSVYGSAARVMPAPAWFSWAKGMGVIANWSPPREMLHVRGAQFASDGIAIASDKDHVSVWTTSFSIAYHDCTVVCSQARSLLTPLGCDGVFYIKRVVVDMSNPAVATMYVLPLARGMNRVWFEADDYAQRNYEVDRTNYNLLLR